MKLHEFYAKYANIPLSGKNNRFLVRKAGNGWDKSPDEIYKQIKKYEEEIAELQGSIEVLLGVADNIM